MTDNYLIGGPSSLQNELLRLLSDKLSDKSEPENKPESKPEPEPENKPENVEIKEVITDAISKQNKDDAKYVNSDMNGGTNIVGMIDNILAGGGLGNESETSNSSSNTSSNSSSNSAKSPEDSIREILEQRTDEGETLEGGNASPFSLEEEEEQSDTSSDEDDEIQGKYIKIISEMRDNNSSTISTQLTGGNVESVKRVKVLNMYPWILKSMD